MASMRWVVVTTSQARQAQRAASPSVPSGRQPGKVQIPLAYHPGLRNSDARTCWGFCVAQYMIDLGSRDHVATDSKV